MTSSNAQAEVHDAGTATMLLALRSAMMAAVVGEPRVWARARMLGLISWYTSLCVCGLYLLSLTYFDTSISYPPMPPALLTRFQKAAWAFVIGTASGAN